MNKIFDRESFKEFKKCLCCEKIFTIRKKWKNNFDEIRFCSKKCKSEFKNQK